MRISTSAFGRGNGTLGGEGRVDAAVVWRAASEGHEENRVDVGGEGGDVLFRGGGGIQTDEETGCHLDNWRDQR